MMPLHLGVFATHPIQYVAPVWRRLAQQPGLELKVHFFSDHSVRGGVDPGFGVPVAWDVPLTDGYEHEFLERRGDEHGFRRSRIPEVAERLASFDWVMVHGYRHPFERQAVFGARRRGARTLLRGELTDARRPGQPRFRRLLRRLYLTAFYRRIDAFCYLGCQGREHLTRHGIDPRRTFFSPYSIDDRHFETLRRRWPRAAARRDLGLAEHDRVVLMSAKLIPRKAPLLLAEAVRRLDDDRVVPIVLGDGPLRGEVEAALRNACGERFVMPGFVNQSRLGVYFAAADVFVLPSRFETWGLVVNEAMQFGLPVVVSSAVGCHRDLVIEGETGMVFPTGDAAALESRLRELVGDRERAARMGTRGRAHVARYSIQASVDGILEPLGDTSRSLAGEAPAEEIPVEEQKPSTAPSS